MDVNGLKITDILNIDLDTFNNMNESDLRNVTSRLVSAANKRIRRLEKHNLNTNAYQGLGDDKRFSTKLPEDVSSQQRVNRLRAEFSRARSFLTLETSTISGFNRFVKRTRKRIAKELNISEKDLKKIDVKKLFDILHSAQEKGFISSYRHSEGSLQARNMIADLMQENPNLTEENFYEELEKQMTKKYEQEEEKRIVEDETDETTF